MPNPPMPKPDDSADHDDDVDDVADESREAATSGAEALTESPDGAAVFPLIPEELGIHPLLMAALHAYVFLEGSTAEVLNPAVADEAMNYIANYLQRLAGADLRRAREDMATLVGFARSEKWPKQHVRFLQEFLKENGIPQ